MIKFKKNKLKLRNKTKYCFKYVKNNDTVFLLVASCNNSIDQIVGKKNSLLDKFDVLYNV